MSNAKTDNSKLPLKIVRRGVIYDPIHPRDFMELDITYCCEQCTHYREEDGTCTIGYETSLHKREAQLKMYEMSGRMAFCRFSEID